MTNTHHNEHCQILIFYVRTGRDRAMELAKSEALSVFRSFTPALMNGGPWTGDKKVFCVRFPDGTSDNNEFLQHCHRLGYTEKVSLAEDTGPQKIENMEK